ncbi:Cytokine receptor [Halotydeus destructor]|nr:Cytokine receptor [Halotydeus destructor]
MMVGSFASLVVLFVAFNFKPVWNCVNTHNLGDMTLDLTVAKGSDTSLVCNLHVTEANIGGESFPVDSSRIKFRFNSSYISEDRVFVLNETAAELRIPNAHPQDEGFYYCYLNINPSKVPMVCSTHLKVGMPPSELPESALSCIGMHYESLICNVHPQNETLDTTYEIFRIDKDFKTACSDKINATACRWTSYTQPAYRKHMPDLDFGVLSSNELGKRTAYFQIDHFAIIKPGHVKSLRVTSDTPNSINLTWDVPERFNENPLPEDDITPRLEYQILVNASEHQDVIIDVGQTKWFNVTQLVPFTVYRFSVRCKTLNATDEQFWSDYASIDFEMKRDIPYYSPTIIASAYEARKYSETNRSIVLHWEPVDEKYQNAPDLEYVLYYWELKPGEAVASGPVNTLTLPRGDSMHKFNNLSPNSQYMFTIHSHNELGQSTASSALKVSEDSGLPPAPVKVRAIFAHEANGYKIEWKYPFSNETLRSYTVAWCKARVRSPDECIEPLQFKMVLPTKSDEQSTIVSELKYDEHYRFAVAANLATPQREMSSSLAWDSGDTMTELAARNTWLVILVSAIACFLVTIILLLMYTGARKVKKMYDDIKKPGIELPPGLQTIKIAHNGRVDGVQQVRQYDDEHGDDEGDLKLRHGSGTSNSSAHSAGCGSHSSGHGSGTSPSNTSSTAAFELTNIKNPTSSFMRTISEPTSDTGDSVASKETCLYPTQNLNSIGANANAGTSDIFSHDSASHPFVKQQNGYVTLPSNGNGTSYIALSPPSGVVTYVSSPAQSEQLEAIVNIPNETHIYTKQQPSGYVALDRFGMTQ